MYLNKLNTKEDPYFLHKTFGIICLLNYIYRFTLLITNGDMDLNNNLGVILLFCHLILSTSSIIFKISSTRNKLSPMIYPEFRLHSIIFASRSIVCCILSFFQVYVVYKMIVCILTMIFADIATHYCKNGTTIRNTPFYESINEERKHSVIKMYSGSQIEATMLCLENMETAFSPLFPIQIAAFCMTLVRKGIIANKTYQLIYTLSSMSASSAILTLTTTVFVKFFVMTRIVVCLRFKLNLNKYICWLFTFLIYIIVSETDVVIQLLTFTLSLLSNATFVDKMNMYKLTIIPLIYANIKKLYEFSYLFYMK